MAVRITSPGAAPYCEYFPSLAIWAQKAGLTRFFSGWLEESQVVTHNAATPEHVCTYIQYVHMLHNYDDRGKRNKKTLTAFMIRAKQDSF